MGTSLAVNLVTLWSLLLMCDYLSVLRSLYHSDLKEGRWSGVGSRELLGLTVFVDKGWADLTLRSEFGKTTIHRR